MGNCLTRQEKFDTSADFCETLRLSPDNTEKGKPINYAYHAKIPMAPEKKFVPKGLMVCNECVNTGLYIPTKFKGSNDTQWWGYWENYTCRVDTIVCKGCGGHILPVKLCCYVCADEIDYEQGYESSLPPVTQLVYFVLCKDAQCLDKLKKIVEPAFLLKHSFTQDK